MNNKSKILLIVISILAIIAIIAGIVVNSVQKEEQEKERKQNLINSITQNHESLKTAFGEFTTKRQEVTELTKDVYTDNINEINAQAVALLDAETLIIDRIKAHYESIAKDCLNKDFDDKDANSICKADPINYEKAMNIFISDVASYVELQKLYNESVKEDKQIVLYTTKYEKVDVNGDGVYEGLTVIDKTPEEVTE